MKPRISSKSIPWLVEIDRHVRQFDVRGAAANMADIACDVLDGWATRDEIDDLVRRGFLAVVRYRRSECDGWLWEMDRRTCGTRWSVVATEKMLRTFWPDRIVEEAA